jgi:hypothetical protein
VPFPDVEIADEGTLRSIYQVKISPAGGGISPSRASRISQEVAVLWLLFLYLTLSPTR